MTTTTTTVAAPGGLWAEGARDWADVQEQGALPLHVLLLDAGCGAGLVALLARLRGATVTVIGASAELLAVARERLPDADLHVADLQVLPVADGAFDVGHAVNSLFFAADMAGRRGTPDRCESLTTMRALAPLMPRGISGAGGLR